jgi:hypothetical protein
LETKRRKEIGWDLVVSLLLVVLVVIDESKDEEDSSAGFSGLLKTDAPNQTKPANERDVWNIQREWQKRTRRCLSVCGY